MKTGTKAKRSFTEGYKTYDPSEKGYGNARQWRSEFRQRMTGEEAEEILSQQEETPYSILGVKPGAMQEEIKKAYYKIIMVWHPDRNPHRLEEATRMSKLINAAYAKLAK